MIKNLVLLMAVCCLLVSCQKEDGSGSGANNVDGSTWVWSDDGADTIVLKGGFASYYYNRLRDTQSYYVKGNELIFSKPLHRESGESDIYYDSGSFNKDYSKLTISGRKTNVNSPGVLDFKRTFNRVAE